MRVDIELLGFPQIRCDGRRLDLGLRKGLALIAYLADARGPVSRDMLATLLWPDAGEDDARARLRRTLHKLRAVFADAITADRSSVSLSPSLDVHIDAHVFEAACDEGRFEDAERLYAGDFFSGLSIDGCPELEEWAFFRREALRSRLLQALERVIESKLAAGDHRAALEPATRLVALDPLSESGHRHLIRAHLLGGERAAAERQYETCARLLREELGVAPDAQTKALLGGAPEPRTLEAPRVRYAERNGIHLAYQTIGKGPLDIVFVPGFVSHVERAWDDPRARALLTALAAMGRLILFDRRGVGLSDRVGAAPTVEATADDIACVMDAAGSRRALLIGASEGGTGCIAFAARRSDRLAGLVLYGALAKGSWAEDYRFALKRDQYDAWLRHLVKDWGGPAGLTTFAPSLADDQQAQRWWSGLLRASSSPGTMKAVLESLRDADVRALLPRLSSPTLVLHRRGDRVVRVEAGRYVAEQTPGATFIELDGDDHWMWAGDQRPLLAAIGDFIRRILGAPRER